MGIIQWNKSEIIFWNLQIIFIASNASTVLYMQVVFIMETERWILLFKGYKFTPLCDSNVFSKLMRTFCKWRKCTIFGENTIFRTIVKIIFHSAGSSFSMCVCYHFLYLINAACSYIRHNTFPMLPISTWILLVGHI